MCVAAHPEGRLEALPYLEGKRGGPRQALLLWPSSRAGKQRIARTNPSSPSTTKNTKRNGTEKSQTSGNNTKASTASGQQRTNKRHQIRNKQKIFIPVSLCV